MKSIAQLLLYPCKVCVLSEYLVNQIDPNLMTVPKNVLKRLTVSDEILEVANKKCKSKKEAAKWLIAEAVIYEKMSCVYIKNNQVIYINNLSGKQVFDLNCVSLNRPDYFDKLRASYLIRWGARLQDFSGDFIKVIDPENNEHLTTPHRCDCLDFEKSYQCEHISLIKVFLENRKDLKFLEIN